MAKKKTWKQCSTNGCRRRRTTELYCALCQKNIDEAANPIDSVKKLSELDRLRFFELEIALRSHAQAIQILDQEQRIENTEHVARKQVRQNRVDELKVLIQQLTGEQTRMLAALAKKYDFDPNIVCLDDKTGVIQEHPPDE